MSSRNIMNFVKCPVCSKNFLNDDEEICSFCQRKGLSLETLSKPAQPIYKRLNDDCLSYDYKTSGTYVGTNSREIYINMCLRFGWRKGLEDHFGKLGDLLYEINIDKQGNSVWFLPHTTNNKKDPHQTCWKNTLFGDRIEEEWLEKHWEAQHPIPNEKRITFVKNENGDYRFKGVFVCSKIIRNERGNIVRTYTREVAFYPYEILTT